MPILGVISSSKLSLVPNSFESIQTVTVGSTSVPNIEFTSIPNTFKHLQIRCFVQEARATYGISDAYLRFNSASSDYSWHSIKSYGGGTADALTATSVSEINVADGMWGTTTGGTFGIGIIDILDYANTSKYKTLKAVAGVDFNGTAGGYGGWMGFISGNWRNTNAITSIKITAMSGNFQQHSSFALYGIKG